MNRDKPLSVYFTAVERRKLAKLAEHYKRSESDQIRWFVENCYAESFGQKPAKSSKNRASK